VLTAFYLLYNKRSIRLFYLDYSLIFCILKYDRRIWEITLQGAHISPPLKYLSVNQYYWYRLIYFSYIFIQFVSSNLRYYTNYRPINKGKMSQRLEIKLILNYQDKAVDIEEGIIESTKCRVKEGNLIGSISFFVIQKCILFPYTNNRSYWKLIRSGGWGAVAKIKRNLPPQRNNFLVSKF
jgi:hypothetical protein